ncbi:formate dehydrogenase accessory sulfurtransferase FdhD [Kingella negevensis]|uniref:formate dehydrogenase accessory sulfurtransferase FdhD n=1 Tax=Kingella negevensis TaxID=1522312 RepID=UPI00050A1851|nr:formate dehydrogenase accessory sulfurtransferase FdhD [Kingella negevensis]MDK4688620.1 formate dehydrogenase accessory sulfurtransferase FdhD [Kingella negevensis]WII91635.1 formate dehydrogenase accessory sulfurtransferase FdhD [Kingella negevensis]WII92547.1 formate dehydrogenase accessory sulfurtransferase FdhD [Kingella negevensis]
MNPTHPQTIHRYHSGSLKTQQDTLAEEIPVALVYNGISHVVLMATPQNLEELALGFSLSEGILTHPSQLYDCVIEPSCQGISVQLEIASARFALLKERRRSMAGRTGCGLCGIDSLAAIAPNLSSVTRQHKIQGDHITQALRTLPQYQQLREQTGSLHGAAWVEQGNIQAAFEDVGRHNALDKLLGYLAKKQIDTQNGFIIVSSRASYEMVAKTAAMGIGCLVAVSAATALAVRVAEQANVTLIGFAKPQQFIVYSHEEFVE